MQRETIEFLWEAVFKDNKQKIRDTVDAVDMYEAINIIDNRYGISSFEKLKIEPARLFE